MRILSSLYQLITLLALMLATPIIAQNISNDLTVLNIGVADGLSQSTARDLAIDKQGFLWIGTYDGLNRFDGKNFSIYKPEFGNPNSINDKQIRALRIDEAGLIWVKKVDGGYSCYNPKVDAFITVRDLNSKALSLPYDKCKHISDSTIVFYGGVNGAYYFRINEYMTPVCIWQDTSYFCGAQIYNNELWLCGQDIVKLDPDGKQYRIPLELDIKQIRNFTIADGIAVLTEKNNTLHLVDLHTQRELATVKTPKEYGTVRDVSFIAGSLVAVNTKNDGLKILDVAQKSYVPLSVVNGEKVSGQFGSITHDRKGGLWFYSNYQGAIYHIDCFGQMHDKVQVMDEETAKVIDSPRLAILADKHSSGVYWITSYGGGLIRYDENKNSYEQIASTDNYIPKYLISSAQDNYGNIWVGSENLGITKISPKKYHSRTIKPSPTEEFNTQNNVRVIYEDNNGNVWCGIRNGSLYVYNNNLDKQLFCKEDIKPYAITTDNQGRIWVGTRGNGIYIFDSTTFEELKHLKHAKDNPNSLSNNNIFRFIVDNSERMWVATFGGTLDLLVEQSKENGYVFNHYLDSNNQIRDAYQDSRGMIWTSTADGLICFSPDELIADPSNYISYSYDLNDPDGISCKEVRAICEDYNHRIWIGTGGGGLNMLSLDIGHAKFKKFTTKDGLPSDIVSSVLCTNDSTMWIGTENGLSRFDLKSEQFYNLSIADTKIGEFFNDQSFAVRSNGNILWGTLDGIIEFNPNSRVSIRDNAPTVISQILINNKRIIVDENFENIDAAPTYATRLTVEKNNDITIKFATLNFENPGVNKFYYKLEGLDEKWSHTADGLVNYQRLKAGTYTFLVRNAYQDEAQARRLTIVIDGGLWQSTPMICLYVLLAILLLFLLILGLRSFHANPNREATEREIERYKHKFFVSLNNHIRSPMKVIEDSLTAIHDIVPVIPQEVKSHLFVIDKNVGKLSDMVEALLEFRDAKYNQPLTLESTNLSPFLNEIFKSFSQEASEHKIKYQLNVPGGWHILLDRDKISRVVFSLLNNAFQHTPVGGTITLVATQNNRKECIITVTDTGPGVPKEKRSMLFADIFEETTNEMDVTLAVANCFIRSHHGKISYNTGPGDTGSILTIALPTDYSGFPDANVVENDYDDYNSDFIAQHNNNIEQPHTNNNDLRPVVLVVNNNRYQRDFLAERLSAYYHVLTANNDGKAQNIILNATPDLILCEANQDNTDFTRRLRMNFNLSHIPIIMLADKQTEAEQSDSPCLQPDAILTTPLVYNQLLTTVRNNINQQLNLRVNFALNNGALATLDDESQKIFDNFVSDIRSNVTRINYGIDDVAQNLELSRDELYDKIVSITGCKPGEYVKLWRLNYAKEDITKNATTITQATQNAGFVDQAFFNRWFEQVYGSPADLIQPDKNNTQNI